MSQILVDSESVQYSHVGTLQSLRPQPLTKRDHVPYYIAREAKVHPASNCQRPRGKIRAVTRDGPEPSEGG